MKLLCLLTGGPCQWINAGGKRYRFEWHPYFGPIRLDGRTDDESLRQPDEDSPFWNAVEWWDKQGRRVQDSVAVWNRERPAKYETIQIGPRSSIQGRMIDGECCELGSVR